MTVTRQRLPWTQFIGTGCRCDITAPCLYHYDQALDWRGRATALANAGIRPATGR
jgi:hypothetical protein